MASACIKFVSRTFFPSLKPSFQGASSQASSSASRVSLSGLPISTSRCASSSTARRPADLGHMRKQQRGRMKGSASQGTRISFGGYALQALELAWVSSRQIEAGRRAMIPFARRGGKIWVRVFADKPITGRPAETRMGKGKGAVKGWVAVVKPGRLLFEMGGVSEAVAREATAIAGSKMPIRTRFVIRR